MRKNGPKVRISRYLGIAITKKAAKVMEKKTYGPGQAGATKKFRGKMSVYKTQLLEKQKVRAQYNISEKQMRDNYKEASRLEGNTVELLAQLLERRSFLPFTFNRRCIYQRKIKKQNCFQ